MDIDWCSRRGSEICGPSTRRSWPRRSAPVWSGTALELWVALCATHRASRHGGHEPGGEYRSRLDGLCRALRMGWPARLRLRSPGCCRRKPIASLFQALIVEAGTSALCDGVVVVRSGTTRAVAPVRRGCPPHAEAGAPLRG